MEIYETRHLEARDAGMECPRCGQLYQVQDVGAERVGVCTECGHRVPIEDGETTTTG